MTKTAEKPYHLGPHIPIIAHIREYPPGFEPQKQQVPSPKFDMISVHGGLIILEPWITRASDRLNDVFL